MILFFFFGMLLGSVANTLVASCSADIGRGSGLTKSITSTVTGIIDGSGGVGSAVAMYLIGVIRKSKGWQLGYLLPISIVCSLSIIPISVVLKKEIV